MGEGVVAGLGAGEHEVEGFARLGFPGQEGMGYGSLGRTGNQA
jgi:hypothetical protein